MMTWVRYVVLVLGIIIGFHFILSVSHEGYGNATSVSKIKDKVLGSTGPPAYPPEKYYDPGYDGTRNTTARRANAAFVVLARNGDLKNVASSMKQMEDRFNKKYNYPYIFLNEQPFSEEFKKWISYLTDAEVKFGLIPKDDWYQPDWIDEKKATAARQEMERNRVPHGGKIPYRNMCRFNSGFVWRHPLLDQYKYYWRIEPNVHFYCDVDFDPFLFMQDNDKKYAFTISRPEVRSTVPTLWDAVKEFVHENPSLISPDNAMKFLSDDGGESWNLCSFYNNFEIADLDLWRGEGYRKFFEHLDHKGGFYYERWGDANVHSIGAALFARKDQIHFFDEIGYRHGSVMHCPQGDVHRNGKCWCEESENFDHQASSCLNKYTSLFK